MLSDETNTKAISQISRECHEAAVREGIRLTPEKTLTVLKHIDNAEVALRKIRILLVNLDERLFAKGSVTARKVPPTDQGS